MFDRLTGLRGSFLLSNAFCTLSSFLEVAAATYAGGRPCDASELLDFHDFDAAARFLRQFSDDYFAKRAFHSVLAAHGEQPSMLSDDRVEHRIADLLVRGRLFVIDLDALAATPLPAPAPAPASPHDVQDVPDEAPIEERHDLLFEYLTEFGDPVVNLGHMTLVGPDGAREPAALQAGRLERLGIAPGEYRLIVPRFAAAEWGHTPLRCGESVQLVVATRDISDGTRIELEVRDADLAAIGAPLAALEGVVEGDGVRFDWVYEQAVGEPLAIRLRFEARFERKSARSGLAFVSPYPLTDLRGVQERLRTLGYDPGPPSATTNATIERAVRAFQQDNPPLRVDGVVGAKMRQVLGHGSAGAGDGRDESATGR